MPPERPRTHHLHVCEVDSEHELRHVAVRDFLRTHSDDAARYAALKNALVARNPRDRSHTSRARATISKRSNGAL
jgi:GrpB-like predicted nucleotidyltransferase (UPF0157 family)